MPPPKGSITAPVLKGIQTASNMRIAYPRDGQAEVVSVTGVLEPGGQTSRHQHPVPVFVYVLEGTFTRLAARGFGRALSDRIGSVDHHDWDVAAACLTARIAGGPE